MSRLPIILLLMLCWPADALRAGGSCHDAKLGPQVRKFLKTHEVGCLPVVVVGQTQLLDAPSGFGRFCQEHADADRRVLRRDVLSQLKQIAAEEQTVILERLGEQTALRGLWIINGFWAKLTPTQIRTAATLDQVGLIFVDWPVKPATGPDRFEEHLPEAHREPFDLGDKVVPWELYESGVPEVWHEFGISGEGAVVAMAGDGANYWHADLRNNIWVNTAEIADNGKDDDGNGYVDDRYGYDVARLRRRVASPMGRHRGTWACGLVAGDGSSGTATGAAPRAQLMLLRARGGHLAAMLAVQYALDNGADIMHIDLSYPQLGMVRGVWRRMCQHATCAGLLIVCPTPDRCLGYPPKQRMHTPADIPCVVTVSGISPDRQVPAAIGRGPVVWQQRPSHGQGSRGEDQIKPDLVGFRGPGVRLLRSGAGAGYLPSDRPWSANVFASARVAGIAALVVSARPSLPAWRVREILETTATDLPPVGKDNDTGAGLVNAYAAVAEVLDKQ